MSATEKQHTDLLVQGLTMDAKVHFLMVSFKGVLNAAIDKHGLNKGSTQYLAQAMASSLLLSSQIKSDERLSVQLESSEPECRIICDINANGGIRGKITPVKMPSNVEIPTLDGFFVNIKHNKERELYRGTTEIRTETIDSALEHHLNQSAQIQCMVRIEILFDDNGRATSAKGMLLEKYPESDDNPSATPIEFAMAYTEFSTMSPKEFIAGCEKNSICGFDLFTLETKPISWFCGCSDERINTMLSSIGPDELRSMIEDLGEIEVVCEFCSVRYVRNKKDVEELIEEISYI
jgi:molecular chaperone Hsp33